MITKDEDNTAVAVTTHNIIPYGRATAEERQEHADRFMRRRERVLKDSDEKPESKKKEK